MLHCLWKTGADVPLKPDVDITIGRNPQTTIVDLKCPRRHLNIRYNPEFKTAAIQPISDGIRRTPFAVNGKIMYDQCTLNPGDILDILPGKYKYRFEIPEATTSVDRKEDTDTVLVCQTTSVTVSKTVSFSVEVMPEVKAGWTRVSNELMVYTDGSTVGSEKVAGFDLDGTLIVTKSGRVFPKDVDDWKIAYSTIPAKLKQLKNDGYHIVIFTNQKGISSGHCSESDFQKKVERIMDKLSKGVVTSCFVSPGSGFYRKPLIGMWEEFEKNYNCGIKVDLSRSFYVGDAAGRSSGRGDGKKDHSCADRLFALNLGLRFMTPEEFFLDKPPQSFQLPQFSPNNILDQGKPIPLLDPSTAQLPSPSGKPEVIVLVGYPASGKTVFYDNHLKSLRYAHVSRDELGTWQKCVQATEKYLTSKQSVVVDNTNPDAESRKRYIEVAKRNGAVCRCFIINCTYEQALHNNKFRQLIGADRQHRDVNVMVINSYRSKFQQPTVEEGFDEIVRVNFIPHFNDEKLKKLYGMYLVEK